MMRPLARAPAMAPPSAAAWPLLAQVHRPTWRRRAACDALADERRTTASAAPLARGGRRHPRSTPVTAAAAASATAGAAAPAAAPPPPSPASLEADAAARHEGLATAGEDTIASVVTGPPGQGAVSIIRVSGPRAMAVAAAVFRPGGGGAAGGGRAAGEAATEGAGAKASDKAWRPRSHRVYYGVACDPSASAAATSSREAAGVNGGGGGACGADAADAATAGAAATATATTRAATAAGNGDVVIDEVLLIPMLSPRSYTREDVAEIHCHGGAVCAGRVLAACLAADRSCRPARPGEFTLRAFLNGRLNLAQAEAVAELVSARSPAAADSALAGVTGGGVGAEVARLRAFLLTEVLSEVEARIDFEDDVGPLDADLISRKISAAQRRVEAALRTARDGGLMRRGLQVAIVGRPNVGKSSLLNAWTGGQRAIVTAAAGTTRDVVEASLVVAGAVPVTLLDTAGIRGGPVDEAEGMGIARSIEAARGADVVVMVADAGEGWTTGGGGSGGGGPGGGGGAGVGVGSGDSAIFEALWGGGDGSPGDGTGGRVVRGEAILVWNKADLLPDGGGERDSEENERRLQLPMRPRDVFGGASRARVVIASAATGAGLAGLERALLDAAGSPQIAATGGRGWAVNERQAEALVRAHEALSGAGASVAADLPLDCWTVDLRAALLALGEVSGEEAAEEVLDAVFSRFCIGK